MNHAELQEKLWAYYDGELSTGEQSDLLAHTTSCEDCRSQLARWTTTRDRVLNPLRVGASDAFVHAVMRRVQSPDNGVTARSPFFIRWALPTLAFSMASFAAALLYVMQPASASAEALLWADHSSNLSAQWIVSHPTEDQILSSVVISR